jgi:hypothetical protein
MEMSAPPMIFPTSVMCLMIQLMVEKGATRTTRLFLFEQYPLCQYSFSGYLDTRRCHSMWKMVYAKRWISPDDYGSNLVIPMLRLTHY